MTHPFAGQQERDLSVRVRRPERPGHEHAGRLHLVRWPGAAPLAADGWSLWAGAVRGELASRTASAAQLATVRPTTLSADPLSCDLLARVPLHLEHDVPVESVIEFKKTGRHAVETIASAIRDSAPSLTDSAIDVVTAANALAATLWQATHPAAPAGRGNSAGTLRSRS